MHHHRAARLAAVLAAPLLLQACATKGFVRDEVALLRTSTDSSIAAERSARIAADNELGARVAALRTDLDSLRTGFGARITAMEDGLRFAMPVTFEFDDATVGAEDRPMLERFARVANRHYPGATITIEGFADPAGSARYNVALSQRRADNVRAALESLGLTQGQLRTVGYGEARQVAPGAQGSAPRAEQNRRVVFVIESAGDEALVALGPMLD